MVSFSCIQSLLLHINYIYIYIYMLPISGIYSYSVEKECGALHAWPVCVRAYVCACMCVCVHVHVC